MSRCLLCWCACKYTWACVSAWMWMNAFSVYPAGILLLPVCLCSCTCVFFMHRAPKVTCHDTDVRKRRHSVSDKQTMPGGGSKQCAAIALLLSVCPRCRVTEVFNTIKVFSTVQHCVCVCVCLHWQRLPCDWLYWTCSNKAKHTTGAASN